MNVCSFQLARLRAALGRSYLAHMIRPSRLVCLALLLAACSARPEVDALLGPEPAQATYPSLLSMQAILARTEGDPSGEDQERSALLARAAALDAEAERLRRREATN